MNLPECWWGRHSSSGGVNRPLLVCQSDNQQEETEKSRRKTEQGRTEQSGKDGGYSMERGGFGRNGIQ